MKNLGTLNGSVNITQMKDAFDLYWKTQQSTSTVSSGDIDLIAIDPSNNNNMYVANGSEPIHVV